jgi:hypothetical protein
MSVARVADVGDVSISGPVMRGRGASTLTWSISEGRR